MSQNTYTQLEHTKSGKISVELKDYETRSAYKGKKYFDTLQEALEHCKEIEDLSEYGIILGRGFNGK